MNYKYIYRSRKNGIKIRTNQRLGPKKYELIMELRDTQLKRQNIMIK